MASQQERQHERALAREFAKEPYILPGRRRRIDSRERDKSVMAGQCRGPDWGPSGSLVCGWFSPASMGLGRVDVLPGRTVQRLYAILGRVPPGCASKKHHGIVAMLTMIKVRAIILPRTLRDITIACNGDNTVMKHVIRKVATAKYPRRERGEKLSSVPELGGKLLPFLLPRKNRIPIAGDLAEEFREYVARWGRPYAVMWFWWEIFNLAICRFSLLPIATAVAVWLRWSLGW
jgi:hypothetical protein